MVKLHHAFSSFVQDPGNPSFIVLRVSRKFYKIRGIAQNPPIRSMGGIQIHIFLQDPGNRSDSVIVDLKVNT